MVASRLDIVQCGSLAIPIKRSVLCVGRPFRCHLQAQEAEVGVLVASGKRVGRKKHIPLLDRPLVV